MDTGAHQLPQLFSQLGLDSDPGAIKAFLATHWLERGRALPDAAYWNASQSAFLKQALSCDAEWAEAVDELACLLSQP